MADDAPGTGRARGVPAEDGAPSDPVSDVLHRYASIHQPDPHRIKARLWEGMRADGPAARSGGTWRVARSKGPSARRFPVPLVVAAAVAVTALGIPLGLAFLSAGPGPTPPATHATTSGVTSAPASPTPTPSASSPPSSPSPNGSATRKATAARPSKAATPSRTAEAPSPGIAFRVWPKATGEQQLGATRTVKDTFDGGMARYQGTGDLGGDPEAGDLPPLFELADGAVIKNVIVGAKSADGIHCLGTCTLQNVWFEDVGHDAGTLRSTSPDDVMTVLGGGARHASKSIFQHNGPGTVVIRGFQAEDFGKVYRACGNCREVGAHHVVIDGLRVTAPGLAIVGINPDLGDTASLSHLVIRADPRHAIDVCQWYKSVPSGETSPKVGEGPSDACGYVQSDVTYTR